MQKYNVKSNHIDDTSNLFADTLSRIPCFDDTEAYDCINTIHCSWFCYTATKSIPNDKSIFALDLNYMADCQKHNPFCTPIIHLNNTNVAQNFTYDKICISNMNPIFKILSNKIVVHLSL